MPGPRRHPLLVLLVVALLLGVTAAGADASDQGLRTLVAGTPAVQARVERDLRSVGATPTRSVAAAVTHLRRAGRIHDRVRRTVDELRGRYVAERAQTALADEGRRLILEGLGRVEDAAGRLARADRAAASRLTRARSIAAVRRAARSYERSGRAAERTLRAGVERAERGARLVALAR